MSSTSPSKVELVPSADVGGMVRGVGNLTKDALTFKWAQVDSFPWSAARLLYDILYQMSEKSPLLP